jgi:hypothetical protein
MTAALVASIRTPLRQLWPAMVVARLAVLAGWVIAGIARSGTEPTTRLRAEGLLAWDGTWYRDIAVQGYDALPAEALRFFPVFPMIARMLALPFGSGAVSWTLVVVANVAAVVAALMIRQLVIDERDDEALANRAAVALTLFPTAFVLVWGYSESLFLVAAIGVLWGVRTGRWGMAALAGLVAGATRPLGVLLAVAVAVELVRVWNTSSGRTRSLGVVALAAPVVGTGAWLAWVGWRFGDALYPFTGQGDFRGEAVNPLVRLWQGLGEALGPEMFGDGLHLPFAVVFVVLTVVVLRTWPVSYGLFAAAVMLTALAAENLNSLERYALNAFPLVLAVAGLCTVRWRSMTAATVGVAGIVSLSALAWMGIYVP